LEGEGFYKETSCASTGGLMLFHVFFDGLAQIFDGLLIAFAGSINNAVLQVILQNHFAGVIDGGAYGGNLNQYFGTVATFFDHALDRLQMADGAGKTVQNGFGVFVVMAVRTVGMGNRAMMKHFVFCLRHVIMSAT
jgi:hypothetical protein